MASGVAGNAGFVAELRHLEQHHIVVAVQPDFVHVLVNGRIVRSGGPELALELEERGYDWLLEGAATPGAAA